jgi:hypothetical protein
VSRLFLQNVSATTGSIQFHLINALDPLEWLASVAVSDYEQSAAFLCLPSLVPRLRSLHKEYEFDEQHLDLVRTRLQPFLDFSRFHGDFLMQMLSGEKALVYGFGEADTNERTIPLLLALHSMRASFLKEVIVQEKSLDGFLTFPDRYSPTECIVAGHAEDDSFAVSTLDLNVMLANGPLWRETGRFDGAGSAIQEIVPLRQDALLLLTDKETILLDGDGAVVARLPRGKATVIHDGQCM